MSETGRLTMTSASAAAFQASGEAKHLRWWLRESRPDMSPDACRQVAYYARQFVTLFGTEASALAAGPPERIRARLDALNLSQHAHRHLLRAGMALYAAAHDLDGATAQALMDRRKPRRAPRCGSDAPNKPPAAETHPNDARPDADPAAPAAAALPPALRELAAAASRQLAVKRALDDVVDVTGVVQALLQTLAPATRVRLAADVPGAAERPVALPATRPAATPVELADAHLLQVLATAVDRHDAPAG